MWRGCVTCALQRAGGCPQRSANGSPTHPLLVARLQALPEQRGPATTFKFLPGVGHCPHDDFPELVHAELLPWLEGVHAQRRA